MRVILPTPLVSVEWLFENIQNPNLVVLDASLKKTANYSQVQIPLETVLIPQSRYFDIEESFSDRNSDLPHMMISQELFTIEAQKLGINRDSLIVVYDNVGIYSSPRAWWMLKAMGHHDVAILDGGLPAWLEKKYQSTHQHANHLPEGDFKAEPQQEYFCNKANVQIALKAKDAIVFDARSEGRFNGTEPEPRPGVRAGHIPGSVNVPFQRVLNGNFVKPLNELKSMFNQKENTQAKLILTCGSGVTACILALAATIAGYQSITVYDGSWSEWGRFPERDQPF